MGLVLYRCCINKAAQSPNFVSGPSFQATSNLHSRTWNPRIFLSFRLLPPKNNPEDPGSNQSILEDLKPLDPTPSPPPHTGFDAEDGHAPSLSSFFGTGPPSGGFEGLRLYRVGRIF